MQGHFDIMLSDIQWSMGMCYRLELPGQNFFLKNIAKSDVKYW